MCSEGKIKQTSFSTKETTRQVRAPFPLKNGAQASISQLKDRCMSDKPAAPKTNDLNKA
jgi:hypothetical protein